MCVFPKREGGVENSDATVCRFCRPVTFDGSPLWNICSCTTQPSKIQKKQDKQTTHQTTSNSNIFPRLAFLFLISPLTFLSPPSLPPILFLLSSPSLPLFPSPSPLCPPLHLPGHAAAPCCSSPFGGRQRQVPCAFETSKWSHAKRQAINIRRTPVTSPTPPTATTTTTTTAASLGALTPLTPRPQEAGLATPSLVPERLQIASAAHALGGKQRARQRDGGSGRWA